MRYLPLFLLAALMGIAVPSAGQAGHANYGGAYTSLYGGASLLKDADNTGPPFVAGFPDTSVESSFDTGFVVGGTIGHASSSGIWHMRLEADLNYRQHDLDDLTVTSDGGLGFLLGLPPLDGLSASSLGLDVGGDVSTFGALVNAWLDFDIGGSLMPYLGGGLGIADISLDEISVAGIEIVDDSDTVFAYQLGAGLGWIVNPDIVVSLDYRWFATEDPTFEHVLGGEFESEYSNHNFMLGLRIRF